MTYANIGDQRASWRRYYRKNRVTITRANRTRRDTLKAFVKYSCHWARCLDCKIRYPAWKMDFDHITTTKEFNISKGPWKVGSIKALIEEMAKCEVVCANCHRQRTYERRI